MEIKTHSNGKKFVRRPVGEVKTGDLLECGLYVQLAKGTPFELDGVMVKDFWVGARKVAPPKPATPNAEATQRKLDR